ncbi:MAG: site-specific integrase [Acidimicrobiia bacterium]
MIERSPGRWRLQVTADPDPVTGERRRLSRTVRGSRTDARHALQRLVVEAGAGLQGGSTATVAMLLEQFMVTAALAPTTRQDWESVITRHLLPGLGHRRLWKLTARDCDQLYARMAATGIGPSRVRCAHVVLHRAFAQAVRWGWLARNPVSAATRPEVPRSTVTPPTAQQVRLLLSIAREVDPVLACWLQVAVATGARRGEICGLRWADIDLDARTVRIERSVSATKSSGVAITPTKTGRVRRVSLTIHAVEALRDHRTRAELAAIGAAREFAAADHIFTNDAQAQRPWRPELITRRWERLRTRAQLPHVCIHDLRHFVATELLTAGIDVRTVANRLGHARTSTTLDIYWAWVPARDRDAARHLETILESHR